MSVRGPAQNTRGRQDWMNPKLRGVHVRTTITWPIVQECCLWSYAVQELCLKQEVMASPTAFALVRAGVTLVAAGAVGRCEPVACPAVGAWQVAWVAA
jgi:hypothetical protein